MAMSFFRCFNKSRLLFYILFLPQCAAFTHMDQSTELLHLSEDNSEWQGIITCVYWEGSWGPMHSPKDTAQEFLQGPHSAVWAGVLSPSQRRKRRLQRKNNVLMARKFSECVTAAPERSRAEFRAQLLAATLSCRSRKQGPEAGLGEWLLAPSSCQRSQWACAIYRSHELIAVMMN